MHKILNIQSLYKATKFKGPGLLKYELGFPWAEDSKKNSGRIGSKKPVTIRNLCLLTEKLTTNGVGTISENR